MPKTTWDIMALLEACYRVELSEQAWLEECAEGARPFIDRGLGFIAVTYDLARSGEEMFPARVLGPAQFEGTAPDLLKVLPMELLLDWRRRSAGVDGELAAHRGLQEEARQRMPDGFIAMGIDLDNRGCVFAGGGAHPRLTTAQRHLWMRLAAHLATGYSLRRTLERLHGIEVVPVPDGNVIRRDADKCSVDARWELKATAESIDCVSASYACHRSDHSLAPARLAIPRHWTLVDAMEADGRHFVVAHDDRSRPNPLVRLTSRELETLSLLALKQTNKEIAFALGISASTVGVLLHRAAHKLGTRTRAELTARAKALDVAVAEGAAFTRAS